MAKKETYLYKPEGGVAAHYERQNGKTIQVKPGDTITTTTPLADYFPDRFCVASEYRGGIVAPAEPGFGEDVTAHKQFSDFDLSAFRVFRKNGDYHVFDLTDMSKPLNEETLTTLKETAEFLTTL